MIGQGDILKFLKKNKDEKPYSAPQLQKICNLGSSIYPILKKIRKGINAGQLPNYHWNVYSFGDRGQDNTKVYWYKKEDAKGQMPR